MRVPVRARARYSRGERLILGAGAIITIAWVILLSLCGLALAHSGHGQASGHSHAEWAVLGAAVLAGLAGVWADKRRAAARGKARR